MQALTLASVTLLGLVPPVCTIEVNPFAPAPPETYFWGVFSDEMVEAPPGGHPLHAGSGHWSDRDSASTLRGQVVQIGEVAGYGSKDLRRALAGRNRVVVVLWDYDAGCEPVHFGDGDRWGIGGDTAYFRATLRAPSGWSAGVPTFDVYWAGEGIYPFTATRHGREFREHVCSERCYSDRMKEEVLTPVQAFRLVRALPASCDYFGRTFSARMRLRWVMWRWKALENHWPADWILRSHVKMSSGEDGILKRWCESETSGS